MNFKYPDQHRNKIFPIKDRIFILGRVPHTINNRETGFHASNSICENGTVYCMKSSMAACIDMYRYMCNLFKRNYMEVPDNYYIECFKLNSSERQRWYLDPKTGTIRNV